MDRSRIFITCSDSTLLLAETLRDELRTEYYEPRLWSEESKRLPLEEEAKHSDFAVIVLSKDDLMSQGSGETLKARDNCVFEAGLFMSAIGQERCFLVTSVEPSNLSSDLREIVYVRFEEPDLQNRAACKDAIAGVAVQLKGAMQKLGRSSYHVRIPVFSIDEVFAHERPFSENGDLTEDLVIVVEKQLNMTFERVEQLWHNMAVGNSYHFFFPFSDDNIEKLCQALQMIAWLSVRRPGEVPDYKTRLAAIENEKDRALNELRNLHSNRKIRFTPLVATPTFSLRLHNATDHDRARLYLIREESMQFVLWAQGRAAISMLGALPAYIEQDKNDRLLIQMKGRLFDAENKRKLEDSLSQALRRYFPGMESEVELILMGHRSWEN